MAKNNRRKHHQQSQSDPATTVLAAYDKTASLYRDYAQRVRDLIETMLLAKKINIHSVTCRLKDRQSLADKLSRPESDYKQLTDVTDIAGVRIICYFADDVDRVAEVIVNEFAIDRENSVDKRRSLEPDQFGYLSLHHVVTLKDARANLAEYQAFGKLKLEIQTRSILQHAWAEIEHDLGYKSSLDVPKRLRRRVIRLAGLLELADQEFFTVRDRIVDYKRTLDHKVITDPSQVELDKAALTSFVIHNKIARLIDARIAKATNGQLTSDVSVDYALTRLAWFGIPDLGIVEGLLHVNAKWIVRFASNIIVTRKSHPMDRGMSVFYLAYVLASQLETSKELERFVSEAIDQDPRSVRWFTRHIRGIWRKIHLDSRKELSLRRRRR